MAPPKVATAENGGKDEQRDKSSHHKAPASPVSLPLASTLGHCVGVSCGNEAGTLANKSKVLVIRGTRHPLGGGLLVMCLRHVASGTYSASWCRFLLHCVEGLCPDVCVWITIAHFPVRRSRLCSRLMSQRADNYGPSCQCVPGSPEERAGLLPASGLLALRTFSSSPLEKRTR